MTATDTAAPATALRILVGDNLAPEGLAYMESIDGVTVDVKTGLSEDELVEIVGDYDGMVIRSGVTVTPRILKNPGRLRAIARAGVGVDNIDLPAATEAGVLVMNSADASTVTTAEHAFAMLMALARNIGPAYKTMTEGGWDRKKYVGRQLHGKTLGIVGFGRIGRTVAEFGLAFGMKVVAFDPVFNAESALDGRVKIYKDFPAMLAELDVISFHVPLNDHTRGMMGEQAFATAKPGIMVINAARGGVVDIPALLEALENGQCGGAAIDVYEEEPPAADDPLRSHPKILCTPHLGASTKEAQQAVSQAACEQLMEYLMGKGLRGAVNLGGVSLDLDEDQQRYVDLVKRMARLIEPITDENLAAIKVEIHGTKIVGIAPTLERLATVELLNTRLDEPVNIINVDLITNTRGIQTSCTTDTGVTETARICLTVESSGKTRRVMGAVFADDGKPRILQIDDYRMDMVPAGTMVIISNNDVPGVIGSVGDLFGQARINISDMTISKREDLALMVLKVDDAPSKGLLEKLYNTKQIRKVAVVKLPPLAG